jgi:hypothetical protein
MILYVICRRLLSGRVEPAWALDELIRQLQNLPSGRTVLTIPATSLTLAIAYRLEHRFLTAMDTLVWHGRYDMIFKKYPWPSTDLEWWIREHGLEYIAVSRFALSPESGCEWSYDLEGRTLLFENAHYALYAVMPATMPRATASPDLRFQEQGR